MNKEDEINKDIIHQTDIYYTAKAKEFGATSKGVDWNSEESQRIRFQMLTELFSQETDVLTVCDYGCGYGYYSEYLKEKGYSCRYTGIDVSEKMIALANEKYKESENTVFIQGSEIKQTYDYIVASGIFNVRQDIGYEDWTGYMIRILEEFHQYSRKGFAFNCLTKYSDAEYMKDYLYYADPLFYFDYAKCHFARNVRLMHDYDLYEFTLLVRK